MSLVVEIDSNVIPPGDIKSYPTSESRVKFDRNLIGSTAEIILDNTTGEYSDMSTASIFYGSDWLDKTLTIYDSVQGLYTWAGRIKNISQKDSDRTITVKTANYIYELSDITCVYSASAITPARAIYEILTEVVGMTDSYINYNGFQDAINIQTANSALIDITYTASDNKNCMVVIDELLRITCCEMYTVRNIVAMRQWQEYSGELGYIVKPKNVMPSSFESEYEEIQYNAYSIAYKNGASVSFATGTASGTSGSKVFAAPNEEVDSTTATDFKILYNSTTGADWAGELIMARYSNPVKTMKLRLDGGMSFLEPNDQIDIYFGDYTREPVQLTSLRHDHEKNLIDIEGEFRNLPISSVTRDTEPPNPVELICALPVTGGVLLKWTVSTEDDHAGYNIYYTAGQPGQWDQETSNIGISPAEVKTPSIGADGYCYAYVYELNIGAMYYFKVTSFDTSFNESEYSNILSATPLSALGNLYMLQGDIYTGLTLDLNNTSEGTVPSEYTAYSDIAAGVDYTKVITACYESEQYYSANQYDKFRFTASGDSGDIKYSYRTSADASAWSSWSTESDAIGTHTIDFTDNYYFQFRFLFYSPNWTDTDTVRVTSILEA